MFLITDKTGSFSVSLFERECRICAGEIEADPQSIHSARQIFARSKAVEFV